MKKWTADEIEILIEMRGHGKTFKAIAERLGRSAASTSCQYRKYKAGTLNKKLLNFKKKKVLSIKEMVILSEKEHLSYGQMVAKYERRNRWR